MEERASAQLCLGGERRREIRAGLSTAEDAGEFEGFPPGQLFSKAANAQP